MSTENQTEGKASFLATILARVKTVGILEKIPFLKKGSIPHQDFEPSGSGVLAASAGVSEDSYHEPKALPIIGHLSEKSQYRVVISSVALTLLLSAGVGLIANSLSSRMAEIRAKLNTTSQIVLRLTGTVQAATYGSADGFTQSEKAEIEALNAISDLSYYARTSLSESEKAALPAIQVDSRWNDVLWRIFATPFLDLTPRLSSALKAQDSFNKILTYQPVFVSYSSSGARLREMTTENLQKIHEAQSNGLKGAEDFEADLRAMAQIVDEFVANGGSSFSADQFENRRQQAINNIPSGGNAKASALLQDIVSSLTDSLKPVSESVRAANESISHDMTALMGESMLQANTAAKDLIAPLSDPIGVIFLWVVATLLVIAAALELAVLLLIGNRSSEMSAFLARRRTKETDEAVRLVMTELRPISRGDLVKRITVMDNDLSTVADRVNLTIEAIQETLAEVKSSTLEAGISIEEIFNQAKKARDITESASRQAVASAEASEQGAQAVSNAVDRTQKQRTSMQDVSKRMKRLGEVAQSITRVTDIIEEVTAKTEVLAINTALKAADAGEEGAAFRVIAEEIRKLTSDTKRSLGDISTAVQSMQGETQSVIQNVEGVTSELVDSSKYWDGAMNSLSSIRKLADDMKSLMVSVRDSSNLQTKSAEDAVSIMTKLTASAAKFRTDENEQTSS
jgi:twitching motility protein PilJ